MFKTERILSMIMLYGLLVVGSISIFVCFFFLKMVSRITTW